MSSFFSTRGPLQLSGDLANAALSGAKRGFFGSLILAAATESAMPTLASLGSMAAACALGGALLIVPAMLAYRMSLGNTGPGLADGFFDSCVRASFAYVSGCAGAAVLGLAMTPVAMASLSASLVFSLISLMSFLIITATAPKNAAYDSDASLLLGMQVGN